jgi:cobalt-precorrin-5B (C1)-methyltransferase
LYLAAGVGLSEVEVPLPGGGRLAVSVARVVRDGAGARAVVVKDAGDDPDVTDGAEIHVVARLVHGGGVKLDGGAGVGRATLPGLPIGVGEPAINPDPRRQIETAALEGLAGSESGIELIVEVPDGERLARKTMNPRLGVKGGISILGTRGTVIPFSHESWMAAVEQAMDVARAKDIEEIALATGRRSAQWVSRDAGLSEFAVIEMADFYGRSLGAAAERGFRMVRVACMFGKLVKHALGLENTHARYADIDFSELAAWCVQAGLEKSAAQRIESANTGRQVLGLLEGSPARRSVFAILVDRSLDSARKYSGPGPDLEYRVYDYGGELLAKAINQGGAP